MAFSQKSAFNCYLYSILYLFLLKSKAVTLFLGGNVLLTFALVFLARGVSHFKAHFSFYFKGKVLLSFIGKFLLAFTFCFSLVFFLKGKLNLLILKGKVLLTSTVVFDT